MQNLYWIGGGAKLRRTLQTTGFLSSSPNELEWSDSNPKIKVYGPLVPHYKEIKIKGKYRDLSFLILAKRFIHPYCLQIGREHGLAIPDDII